ncbi:hypothetical protein F4778DRAFT_565466 [Xylariomycetidae sp. FL2044]|nr:hypothetical protein F4778DRAFT_565466 [Xylariomycetidae sp. FL2044]
MLYRQLLPALASVAFASVASAQDQNDLIGAVGSLGDSTSTLNSSTLNTLLNLTDQQLNDILGYHILNGTLAYSAKLSSTNLTSTGMQQASTSFNGQIFVKEGGVLVAIILCKDGFVHKIDHIMNADNTNATTLTSPEENGSGSAPSSSSSEGAGSFQTAAVGAAALFGGAAVFVNL